MQVRQSLSQTHGEHWSAYCLIGIANVQAFILSPFSVIGCVPPKKCIIVGKVAQLKQTQRNCQLEAVWLLHSQQLGRKSFLEEGFRPNVSMSTIVHPFCHWDPLLMSKEELPQPFGAFFLHEEQLRKRKLVESTATEVSLKVATNTWFLFSTLQSIFLSSPATTHAGLGGFPDGVTLTLILEWSEFLVTIYFSGWGCCFCTLRVTMDKREYQEMPKLITCVPWVFSLLLLCNNTPTSFCWLRSMTPAKMVTAFHSCGPRIQRVPSALLVAVAYNSMLPSLCPLEKYDKNL